MDYDGGFTIEQVRHHWDEVAPIYDDANSHKLNPHTWRFVEGVKYLKPSKEEIKVLSLWSRTGNAIPYIRSKLPNAIIYNLELSKEMINLAKKIYPKEKFMVTNLEKIDIKDNYFDYIMSPETLEHTPHPEKLIKEFYRVLKPNGKLILSLPPRIADFHQVVYEFLIGGHGDGPRKGIPSWVVKSFLKQARFNLELHKAILLFPIGPTWFIKLGDKIMKWMPLLKELGVMQFYICRKTWGDSNEKR